VAILIARGQGVDLPHYMNVALDSGVTPRELSEVITHLAFYSGWSNAMMAVSVAKDIFAQSADRAGSAACRMRRASCRWTSGIGGHSRRERAAVARHCLAGPRPVHHGSLV
jgi:hypothetical protein